MDEAEEKNTSQTKLIVNFNWLFFGCLFVAGLLDNVSIYARFLIILTAMIGMLIGLFNQRLVSTGPYDEKILTPLRLWPLSILLGLIVAFTGGLDSGYFVVFIYPIVASGFFLDNRQTLTLLGSGYVVMLVFSFFSEDSRAALIQRWPLFFLQLGVLFFIAYWLHIIANALLRERGEKQHIIQLDKEKTEFVGLASHHLRTPLTSVKGYVDYFLRGAAGVHLSQEQAQILERLDGGLKKLESVVENLLMAASMEEGKIKLNSKLSNLARVVESVALQFKNVAEEKKIKLVYEIPQSEQLQEVMFDENKIRKVLFNLIDNAIKFTQQGFVKVVVKVGTENVAINIVDSGIGIPQKNISSLFQKFSRVSSVRGAFDQEGVGLGLYISRLIVEAHGGLIKADSEPGKGSVFQVLLPLKS